jgi:ATP-dependent DNA ligase
VEEEFKGEEFMNWVKTLEKLSTESSTTKKVQLIVKHKKVLLPIFRELVNNSNYGVTSTQVKKRGLKPSGRFKQDNLKSFIHLLKDLSKRKFTGHAAIHKVQEYLGSYSEEEVKWLSRLLDKNMRMGVAKKVIEQALGKKFIDKYAPTFFDTMQAKAPGKGKTFTWDGPRYIEPKFDGMRLVLIYDKENGTRAVSRGDNDYSHLFQPILSALVKAAKELKLNYLALDSECVHRYFTWNLTQTMVRSGVGPNGVIGTEEEFLQRLTDIRIQVFDTVVNKDWDRPLKDRKRDVAIAVKRTTRFLAKNHRILRVCPSRLVKTMKRAEFIRDYYVEKSNRIIEGVIAKDPKSVYEPGKRPKSWMKMKADEETVDAKIVGFKEGKGRNKGRLGSFIVEHPKTKEQFRTSGRLSDRDRINFWKHRKKLVGVICEVEMQEGEVAKARFPVFVKLRFDKTKGRR